MFSLTKDFNDEVVKEIPVLSAVRIAFSFSRFLSFPRYLPLDSTGGASVYRGKQIKEE